MPIMVAPKIRGFRHKIHHQEGVSQSIGPEDVCLHFSARRVGNGQTCKQQTGGWLPLTPALSHRERGKGGSVPGRSPLSQEEGGRRVCARSVPSHSGRGGKVGPCSICPLSLRERGKGGSVLDLSPLTRERGEGGSVLDLSPLPEGEG